MKHIFLLIFLFILSVFCSLSVKAGPYSGWNNNLNKNEQVFSSQSNETTLLENNYKRNILSLLQKNKEIETELTIIELKIAQSELPTFIFHEKSFNNLSQYMDIIKKVDPYAVITGNFYDWRDTSKYRSRAGLHYGYDIAVPSGTAVVAGWPGEVVDIANWYGQEYGVTVKSPGNIFVTYGHIIPLAAMGQKISVGSLIGMTVIDHVDVKMQDANNSYIDFGSIQPAQLLIEKEDNSSVINPLKSDKYKLKSRSSINKERAYMEYLEESNIFYNLKIQKNTKDIFAMAEDCFKKEDLFSKGCIARKDVDESREKFLKICYNRYVAYKERLSFKLKNTPDSIKVVMNENNIARESLYKARFYTREVKEKKKLTKMIRDNEYLKLVAFKLRSIHNSGSKKALSGFPPLSLGSKESKLSMIETQLKQAEKDLQDSRQNYEKAQNLYSLGYISRKDLEQSGENYQKALSTYREIQQSLMK